jgi:hypothetical protein
MARFWGKIGINRGPVEVRPDVFEPNVEELSVYGELMNQRYSWNQDSMTDSLRANFILSMIVPDDGELNPTEVVYVVWQGAKWSVVGLTYKRPRVEFKLGGLYNG